MQPLLLIILLVLLACVAAGYPAAAGRGEVPPASPEFGGLVVPGY